jgi:hypothetical protein
LLPAFRIDRRMADITSNLLARWIGNGNLNDASGNGKTALVGYGATHYATGPFQGQCFHFSDGSPYDDLDIPALGNGNSEVTVACWVKVNGYAAQFNLDTLYATDSQASGGFQIAFLWGSFVTVWVYGSGPLNVYSGDLTAIMPVGSWHHVGITYKASTGTIKFYLDGVLTGTQTFGGAGPNVNLGTARIGLYESGIDQALNADVYDFRIYNRTLADADVAAIVQNTIYPTDQTADSIKQRDKNTTSKSVLFASTYDTSLGTPASAEVQLYDHGTTNVALAWSPLTSAVISSGFITGYLSVPQGGFYNFRIRTKDSGGTVLETSLQTTNPWGVGILIACLGQSNMVAMFDQNDGSVGSPDSKTRQYRSGAWSTFDIVRPNGALLLSKYVRIAADVPVGLIAYAQGGTTISQWIDTIGTTPWTTFVTAMGPIENDFEFVLWHQGENDAQVPTPKATYKSRLDTLYGNLRTLTGRSTSELKFGCALLGNIDHFPEATDASTQDIRQGQQEWIAETTGAFFAGSSVDMVRPSDAFHWGPTSYGHMGRRYAQAVLKQLSLASYGAEGSSIDQPFLIGSTIVVPIVQDGGTGLTELDGSADGADITGFQVSDSFATTLTISSTAYNRNMALLNLDSTPTGEVRLSYQFGENPSITNPVFDNTSPAGDSLGLPLQPAYNLLVKRPLEIDLDSATQSLLAAISAIPSAVRTNLATELSYLDSNVSDAISEAHTAGVSAGQANATALSIADVIDTNLDAKVSGINAAIAIPVNQIPVPASRTWILKSTGSGLRGELPLFRSAGENQPFAVDFRNDLATNGRLLSLDSVSIVSATTDGGIVISDDEDDQGVDRSQAKIKIHCITAGTYVIELEATYDHGDGIAQVTLIVT